MKRLCVTPIFSKVFRYLKLLNNFVLDDLIIGGGVLNRQCLHYKYYEMLIKLQLTILLLEF